MKDVWVVAEKEIRDYFTGKRFIALFAVVMILCIAGMVIGLSSYNNDLKSYKDYQDSRSTDQYFQQMVADQQKLISDAETRGDSAETISQLKASLQAMMNPTMPSIMTIFNSIGVVFVTVGALLAIIMGFNLITREKESGTIKLLLTRPTYRDSVINGKAIAGIVTIVIVFGAAFLLTMAIMLLYNVVPGTDDLVRITVFFLVAILYMTLFFGIALLISTVSPSSTVAILATISMFILMTVLLGVGAIAGSLLAGPMPEYPSTLQMGLPVAAYVEQNGTASVYPSPYGSGYSSGYNQSDPQVIAYNQANEEYNKQFQVYLQRQQQISDFISLLSPIGNFYKLNDVIINKYTPGQQSFYSPYYNGNGQLKELSILESLSYRWTYLLVFIVEIVAAFGLSYILFMRVDVT